MVHLYVILIVAHGYFVQALAKDQLPSEPWNWEQMLYKEGAVVEEWKEWRNEGMKEWMKILNKETEISFEFSTLNNGNCGLSFYSAQPCLDTEEALKYINKKK